MSTRYDSGAAGGDYDAVQRDRLRQFPKDMYFNAEDHNIGPDALPERELAVIRNARYAAHRRLCTLLEDLQHAAKPLKAFDRNGNIGMAAANLVDTALEAQKVLNKLTVDIAEAEQRFREQSDIEEPAAPPPAPLSAIEPFPQVPAGNGPKPKPGPGLVSVVVPAPSPSLVKPFLTDEAFARMKAQKDFDRGGPSEAQGAGMASVMVFNPDQSPAAQLSAFDRVVAARAANTRYLR